MAKIKIESARVVRYVGSRGGFACEEWITLPDGRNFARTYTVWNEGTAPEIDGIVQVVGTLGAKVRSYVGNDGIEKYVIDLSVNDVTVSAIGVAALPAHTNPAPAPVAAPAPSAEVPF